jgi:hypothetical protein
MTLVKTDQPRGIDQFIDYFGEASHGEPRDPRLSWGPTADLRIVAEHLVVFWTEARGV